MQRCTILLGVWWALLGQLSQAQVVPAKDSLAEARKDARYGFDHRLIPYVVYHEPDDFLKAMRSEQAPGYFFALYQSYQREQPALPDAGPFEFKVLVRRRFPYEVVLLTYPAPFEAPLVFYSATVYTFKARGKDTVRTGLRHLTLERTYALLDSTKMKEPNILCEWRSTSVRGNFGRGLTDVNLDAFYEAALNIVASGTQLVTGISTSTGTTQGKKKKRSGKASR